MAEIDVAIMIEGQDGLTRQRWRRLARAAEDLGFAGFYRSDHFTNGTGPHTDALDLWASLTWLAGNTVRIAFGQLVTPASFRHPVHVAWTAAAIDDLSGGRLRLGLGAGWQVREHRSFGFDLLDLDGRFARLDEALRVALKLERGDTTPEEDEGADAEEPTAGKTPSQYLEDASARYNEAQDALKAGNLAEYQSKIEQMNNLIEQAQKALQ